MKSSYTYDSDNGVKFDTTSYDDIKTTFDPKGRIKQQVLYHKTYFANKTETRMIEFFGESMPKHNLKSMYMVMEPEQKPYESYNWSYTFDSKNRILKTTQEYKDLYDNGKTDETGEYTFLWE